MAEGLAELIGTTCGLVATTDALEKGDDLVGRLADDEARNALGVAVATAMEEAVTDATAFVKFYINELAASALSLI